MVTNRIFSKKRNEQPEYLLMNLHLSALLFCSLITPGYSQQNNTFLINLTFRYFGVADANPCSIVDYTAWEEIMFALC
jgi:hypothetical protein